MLRLSFVFTPAHRGGSGSPLVCLHGFMDTWRVWELVLPSLERRHEVFAPTLPGHAGGPGLARTVTLEAVVDALEHMLDDVGFETAHLVGNSLGGYLALCLATRGRARTVVALAPAGGWATSNVATKTAVLEAQVRLHRQVKAVAPQAHTWLATDAGRRRATQLITVNYEHLPAELLAHQSLGIAACDAVPMIENALHERWDLDAEHVTCPVRIVWGAADALLAWPGAAARYRTEWLPNADWVVLDDIGHCPQLDVPGEAAQLILGFTAG